MPLFESDKAPGPGYHQRPTLEFTATQHSVLLRRSKTLQTKKSARHQRLQTSVPELDGLAELITGDGFVSSEEWLNIDNFPLPMRKVCEFHTRYLFPSGEIFVSTICTFQKRKFGRWICVGVTALRHIRFLMDHCGEFNQPRYVLKLAHQVGTRLCCATECRPSTCATPHLLFIIYLCPKRLRDRGYLFLFIPVYIHMAGAPHIRICVSIYIKRMYLCLYTHICVRRNKGTYVYICTPARYTVLYIVYKQILEHSSTQSR